MIEHTGSSFDWIPSECAACTTSCGPFFSFVTTCEKIVFTELAVASMRFIDPAASSAKLATCHGPYVPVTGSVV